MRITGFSLGADALLHIAWDGGQGPYTLQNKRTLSDAQWDPILVTAQTTAQTAAEVSGFFRVASADALPFLDDFTLGPYRSALDILLRGLRQSAAALDARNSYSQCQAQGYLLQAIAELLIATRFHRLPGGEAVRDEFVNLAIQEADQLMAVAGKVRGGGPGFGLDYALDAFGDGSTNAAFTAYAWQSGLVAFGIAQVIRYLNETAPRHADRDADKERLQVFLGNLLLLWKSHFTAFPEGGEDVGFFWYSLENVDAKLVHNTNALLAMVMQIYAELSGDATYAIYSRAYARLLARRWRLSNVGNYVWNYADDGVATPDPSCRRHFPFANDPEVSGLRL